jgi:hypothetical protein
MQVHVVTIINQEGDASTPFLGLTEERAVIKAARTFEQTPWTEIDPTNEIECNVEIRLNLDKLRNVRTVEQLNKWLTEVTQTTYRAHHAVATL